jgi:hypothetical protein
MILCRFESYAFIVFVQLPLQNVYHFDASERKSWFGRFGELILHDDILLLVSPVRSVATLLLRMRKLRLLTLHAPLLLSHLSCRTR